MYHEFTGSSNKTLLPAMPCQVVYVRTYVEVFRNVHVSVTRANENDDLLDCRPDHEKAFKKTT